MWNFRSQSIQMHQIATVFRMKIRWTWFLHPKWTCLINYWKPFVKHVSNSSKPFKVCQQFYSFSSDFPNIHIEWSSKTYIWIGIITLTPQLESSFDSLRNNQIPKHWHKISYPSDKTVSSYLSDFCDRLKWLQNWWSAGESPTTYWISAFFHPRSFLACIKLDFARKYKIKLEEITVDFSVVNENRYWNRSNGVLQRVNVIVHICFDFFCSAIDAMKEDGIFIHGLFLEAAHWNGTFIDEQILHKPVESFPMIHIKVFRILIFEIFMKSSRYIDKSTQFFAADGNEQIQCKRPIRVSRILHTETGHFEKWKSRYNNLATN